MTLSPLEGFTIVMAFLFIGEWGSTLTKAYLPSVFLSALLFVIGFWTVMPKNIVSLASFGTGFSSVAVGLLLVHLGTLMNLRELVAQWRAVCIALLGVCGTLVLTLAVGTLIFNWHTVVAAVPPLTGGLVAALLMTNGLKAAGITALVSLPVSMFITHTLIGYPLTGWLLKKEDQRLIKEFHAGNITMTGQFSQKAQEEEQRQRQWAKVPKAYHTSAFILFKLGVVAVLSYLVAGLFHNAINANVICLILGVIFHELGFLDTNALTKAGVSNWLMYGLLAYIFAQLSLTTPQQMATVIVQILVLIALGIFGMFLASLVLHKLFHMSLYMAFACSLTALFGFPADYVLTTEVAQIVANNEDEREVLLENTLNPMLVGGFATVSVASVIIASVFLKLI